MFSPIIGFFISLMVSIFLALRRSSSLCLWLALELNILSFLPIIFSERIEALIESTFKYFLIQSIGSIIFLTGSLFLLKRPFPLFSLLNTLPIFLKLGVPPLHGWFVSILSSVSLKTLFILSTIQKWIPLIILIHIKINTTLVMIVIFTTSVISLTLGVSRISFPKILAASSVNNLIWLILASQINPFLLLLVLCIYTLLVLSLVMLVKLAGNANLGRRSRTSPTLLNLIFFSFLSLGGLPPLLGFLRKAAVVKESLSTFPIELILIIVFRSLFILSYYVSIRISSIMSYPIPKNHFNGNLINASLRSSLLTLNLFIPVSLLLYLTSGAPVFNGPIF